MGFRWWIDEARLLGCGNPSDDDLRELAEAGFSIVVSLLKDRREPPGYSSSTLEELGMRGVVIPITDGRAPTLEQMRDFVELMRSNPDAKVVVHCLGGCGRTGTLGAVWLVANGAKAWEAIEEIRRRNPFAIESSSQENAVEAYAASLDKKP